MAYLCVTEQGAFLGFTDNKFIVKIKGETIQSVPAENVELIEIFGNVQASTQCLTKCLRSGIDVIYLSMNGSYQGRLISLNHANPKRQRKQLLCSGNEQFALTISKSIISAKINNQMSVLRRYNRNKNIDLSVAAKEYFRNLESLIDPQFAFHGRNKRPPRDPFNSLLSFGYTLLFNEVIGKIELKNLNPFWGFIHQDHIRHQALASDLMEEWRAVIIDSLAMSCLNGHEISINDFTCNEENNGVYLNREGIKSFVLKYENKMNTKSKYLDYIDFSITFRKAIEYQIESLVKAIDRNDPGLYKPIRIR